LSKLTAQITSTTSVLNVCAPATITFTAPTGASNSAWTFGPYPSSTAASGGFAVVNAGTFQATYSGIVAGSPFTFTVLITVNPRPVANFTILQPSNDCAVKTVTLLNSSTGSVPIVNWTWVYGDGGLASYTNGSPSTYGYVTPGTYSVTLQIVDANGCDDQKTVGTVSVINSPTAVIASNPSLLVGCLSNFSAVFSASNSIGNNLSYNWSFGNGQSSSQVTSSSLTYSSQTGQYLVSLTVTSQGCSNIATTYVTVSPATLSVSVSSTVCLGAPFTATVNSNQPFSVWNLGSGQIALGNPPISSPTISVPGFNSVGIKNITVNAGSSPCIATPVSFTVLVDQVTANFASSSPTVSCASPFAVSYTNASSTNANTFTWTVLNTNSVINTYYGATANHVFSGGSSNPYAVFVRPYTPTVTLIAKSAAGCLATITKTVHSIERPAAWYNVSTKEGCAPLAVSLYDSSIVYPSCPITSYTWNNGASPATIVTGTVALPPATNSRIPVQSFTYATAGTYSPYLIISTASNYTNTSATCTDPSFTTVITVVNPPVVSFNVPSGNFCPDQLVQITNTSPNQSAIQHWHVASDNQYFSGCTSDPNPSWKFTNVGVHNFTLTGYQNSCSSSAVAGPITVQGPICKARYETNCTGNRASVIFSVELQEVSTATLNFGDASNFVFTGNPAPGQVVNLSTTHVYGASGNFIATLTAVNPATGCSPSIYTFVVTVRNAQAVVVSNPTVCLGQPIAFSATGSIDVQVGCSRGYLWYLDGNPPVETTSAGYTTVIPTPGIHTMTLVVKDDNGCMSNFATSVRVSSVTPNFSLTSNTLCLSNATVQITDQSIQTPDAITFYSWNFGDGSFYSNTSPIVPTHTYLNASVPSTNYNITLIATNALGCTAAITKVVSIIKPPVLFQTTPSVFCISAGAAATVSFIPQSTYSTYTINFGTSASSTLITSGISSYQYSLAGTYVASVDVRTPAGCENSGTFNLTGVQTPTADFQFSSPNSTGGNNICSGKIVTFTNTTQPLLPNPIWNLGSGILPSSSNTVSLLYSAPVNSQVVISLSVNSGAPAFCASSVVKNFTIFAFDADFVTSNTLVCFNQALSFSLTPSSFGLEAWVWSFGDATSSSTLFASSTPPPANDISHLYSTYNASAQGNASVTLIYWSKELACRDAKEKVIKVEKINTNFFRNNELFATDTAHCLRLQDSFTDTSTVNSLALSYQWFFGGGASSTIKSPTYTYPKPGTYTVTLITTNEHNCKDSLKKIMTIFDLPTAKILPDSEGYCPNRPFSLAMQGSESVITGTWSPAIYFQPSATFTASNSQYTAQVSAPESTVLALVVTNSNNCVSDLVDTLITIVQPPKGIVWDTSVVVGEPIPMFALIEPQVTYTWTPVTQDLSCLLCYNPISSSTVDVLYTLVMEDKLKCSQVSSTFSIHILPYTSVDLPTAFTPNGDGINDVIYADGWGIRSLNYLRIYNRWGQLLFETNDINKGWDGRYEGVPQNMDTYVYQVSVDTYIDAEPLIKSSTFKLIR
jgi:gliding motility-associated-like protein